MGFLSGGDRNVEARLARQSLLASFNSAAQPLLWQFDLEKNHSFTLSILEMGDAWELGVTEPDGTFSCVCRFPSRADAEEAYSAVAATIMKRKGRGGGCWRWFVAILVVFALLLAGSKVLNAVLSGTAKAPDSATSLSLSENPAQNMSKGSAPRKIQDGVPMQADEVLSVPNEE